MGRKMSKYASVCMKLMVGAHTKGSTHCCGYNLFSSVLQEVLLTFYNILLLGKISSNNCL